MSTASEVAKVRAAAMRAGYTLTTVRGTPQTYRLQTGQFLLSDLTLEQAQRWIELVTVEEAEALDAGPFSCYTLVDRVEHACKLIARLTRLREALDD